VGRTVLPSARESRKAPVALADGKTVRPTKRPAYKHVCREPISRIAAQNYDCAREVGGMIPINRL
jgi:hypothetical protein